MSLFAYFKVKNGNQEKNTGEDQSDSNITNQNDTKPRTRFPDELDTKTLQRSSDDAANQTTTHGSSPVPEKQQSARKSEHVSRFDDSVVESKIRRLEVGGDLFPTRSQTLQPTPTGGAASASQDEHSSSELKMSRTINSSEFLTNRIPARVQHQVVESNRKLLAEMKFKNGTVENGVTIQVAQGNLVTQMCDAIVNAANERLAHGGGVARAIADAGEYVNPDSRKWVQEQGRVRTGTTAWTRAGGRLKCKFVIHGVGPVWNLTDYSKEELDNYLDSVVVQSLARAEELQCTSIAFPAISSGIFGFPVERCSRVMILAAVRYFRLCKRKSVVELVSFTNIDTPTAETFRQTFEKLFIAPIGSKSL